MKRLFRSKIFWSILIILIAIRLIVPRMLVPKINEFLADFSPVIGASIDDLGLGILRGSYQIIGLEVHLKEKKNEQFLTSKVIDISLAWRELFKGRLTADILLDGTDVLLTDDVIAALKKQKSQAKADTNKAKKKLIPFRIERVDIRDSDFEIADLRSVPKEGRWRLTDIDGRVSNVTANEDSPLSIATMKANMFGKAPMKVVAQINTLKKPMAWDTDIEMKNFNLPDANPWLKRKAPMTFTSGKLDLFSEVKSENGRIEGYVKPFFKNADIVADHEKFKNFKQYGIEVGAAAANLIFQNAKSRTMATKVLFAYDDSGFKINSAKALSDAIKNGFSQTLPEGLDEEISLSNSAQKTVNKGDKP